MNCCDIALTKPLLEQSHSNKNHNNNKQQKKHSYFGRGRRRIRDSSSYSSNSIHHHNTRRRSSGTRNGYSEFELEECEEDDEDEEEDTIRYRMGCTKGSCFLTCRRISLLLWKNFLFRRRHYVVTALEIILPTLFAILMAYLRTVVPPGQETDFPNGKHYPIVNEKAMKTSTSNVLSCGFSCMLAYAPRNEKTDSIMKDIRDYLPEPELGKTKFELRSFEAEEEIELYISQSSFNTSHDTIKAAVIFSSGIRDGAPIDSKIAYKIRMVDNYRLPDTREMFQRFQIPGPIDDNIVLYVGEGFSGLQVAIDKVLIKHITNKAGPEINTEGMPYPPFVEIVDFNILYGILLPQLLVLGFIFIVPSIIRNVVSEKETGIKELMKMMGLSNWMHWLGWMLNSLLILMLSVTIVIILFFVPFDHTTGAVLIHSDPTVWWVVLMLYAMSATAFCFFISTFFQKPTLATTAGIVLWLASYYGVSQPLDQKYSSLTFGTKMASALFPNVALHWAIKAMCSFEGKAAGAHWSNLFQSLSSTDNLSVGFMCLMFILDTIMYLLLTVYFESIIPSEFGVRKPWYFIFKPSTWLGHGKIVPSRLPSAESRRSFSEGVKPGFEPEDEGLMPGVIIEGLTKRFSGGKMAVDGVSLKMYDGEITALLGHNGAGKTTTMSMLTGLFAPTSGTARIHGYDITTSMDKVRQSLGLCPQHNMLFDKLTVQEHLMFFGRLKGLTASQARGEMESLLVKLQLKDKKATLSSALSGGQKRKLSLGMALIGGTKVVFLDEPTSGMDPEARRAIWDLLLEMRGERTIILTTHFMEEADVLGDKIAIMASGKVKCHGSPMFLKRFYGAGYTLKMITTRSSSPDSILAIVQKHIPKASLKVQYSSNSAELGIVLPNEDRETTRKFPAMFAELAQLKSELGILTIGLSLTTMDEVFVKVGELEEEGLATNGTKNDSPTGENSNGIDGRSTLLHRNKLKGFALGIQQFRGLLVKRCVYTSRRRTLFVSQFVMPLILLIGAILLSNSTFSPDQSHPPLKMSLDPYKNPITPYHYTDEVENFGKAYEKVAGSSGLHVKGPILTEMVQAGVDDLASYRELYIVGAEFNDSLSATAFFSSIPYHSSPLAINLVSNTILNVLAAGSSDYKLEMTIHPLESSSYSIVQAASPDPMFATVVPILFGVFVPIGLALFAATFLVFPIEEKLCKAKQLQLMTGVNPLIFWGSSFLWDFFVMTILICLMLACFPIFQKFGAFTPYGGGGVIFLILLTYGFSAISFSYLFSLVSASVPGGFSLVTIIHIITGMIMSLVVFILENNGLADRAKGVRVFGRFFPTFGASISIMRYTSIAATNSRCNILSEKAKEVICNPHLLIEASLRQCCEKCEGFGKCFKPSSYLKWEDTTPRFEQIVPGIGQDLMYLFLIGLAYKLLLIIIEYGILKRVLGLIFKSGNTSFILKTVDEDVIKENKRVETLVTQNRVSEDAFVVENLCKSYGSFAAVSNLSFGVHHGECFGLLGVNGAGKTTSFRMLTGDEILSDGNAYSIMYTLLRNRKVFLSNIGYCPQFDGIVGVLTGREMLQLFCRLRGIPKDLISREADKWLNKLGLYESGNVQCRKYSGGMKRRLSAAMAMIGDCPIILLDEPTSGVDPIARRQFWKVITSVKESGQAVILTSHSMEECEALCSRLGIMVNGQFQCLGGVQHLKNKFAQGFSLVLKLKALTPPDSPELASLCNDISYKFNPCVLKDQHQNILQYQVLNTSIPWDVLFQNMEDLKDQYQNLIEDYSVNETTLEEVFLSFARQQYPERQANVSCFKKFITCQCCSK